jgi:exocyst complex component 3
LISVLQAIAIRLVKKAAKMDAASKFKSMQANARLIKHYRSKIVKAITDEIKAKFSSAYEQDERDPGAFLAGLSKWLYRDLIVIEEEVVPCFPPAYEIYSLFVREYHRALNATLQRLLASEPEASVLLELHGWLKEYKTNMRELNVPSELLEPPLLDGKEQALIDDYLQLLVAKLDEWSANLMKTELQEFAARAEPPEVDGDGLYGTQGAVILFQMVNQQCDLAIESGQGLILARVVGDVNRVMRGIQSQWTKVVDAEFKKQMEKPEDCPGGLVEYLIALANDQIKSADYAETLSSRLEPLVSQVWPILLSYQRPALIVWRRMQKYSAQISEKLNDAIDGYLDVAKKCTQTLIDMIFNDLKPAVRKLFQAEWYDGVTAQIVETMRDYTNDYQEYLNPQLLEILVEDLLEHFLVTYITALGNASKLRLPAATNRIKDDVSVAFSYFSTLKPAKELEANFEVLEMILAMLEASKSLVFLSYWQFAKVHGPNLAFVEGLMRARGDFDRSAANEVMESIKRKAKEENLTDRMCIPRVPPIKLTLHPYPAPEPTIMKKVTVQSTFSKIVNAASQFRS